MDSLMKECVYTDIRNDVALRKKIANQLNISDATVYQHAYRKRPKLNDYKVVKIIMEHTGRSEDEIFEPAEV